MDVFAELLKVGTVDDTLPLPSLEDIKAIEQYFSVKLPPSYIQFLMNYSNVILGNFEMQRVDNIEMYLNLISTNTEARNLIQLPTHFFAFLEDNGDYYCFDLNSKEPEYTVLFWSHDGFSEEKWDGFIDWVENCWIKEALNRL